MTPSHYTISIYVVRRLQKLGGDLGYTSGFHQNSPTAEDERRAVMSQKTTSKKTSKPNHTRVPSRPSQKVRSILEIPYTIYKEKNGERVVYHFNSDEEINAFLLKWGQLKLEYSKETDIFKREKRLYRKSERELLTIQ